MFDIAILETNIGKYSGASRTRIQKYIQRLETGETTSRLKVARDGEKIELNEYVKDLMSNASGGDAKV